MTELDFEQRQEAERLIAEAQDEDKLRAMIYELVELRELADIWCPSHGDGD